MVLNVQTQCIKLQRKVLNAVVAKCPYTLVKKPQWDIRNMKLWFLQKQTSLLFVTKDYILQMGLQELHNGFILISMYI